MAGQGITAIRDTRVLTAVFDRERFGLNVEVGVWYFVAQLVTTFTWMIVPLVQGYDVGWNPWSYYGVVIVLNALEATAFVAVFHTVRDIMPLAAAWGGVSAGISAAWRGVIGMLAFEGWTVGPIFDPLALGSNFASGALFALGLAAGVRQLGVVPWAFAGGVAGASATSSVLYEVVRIITQEGVGFIWANPVLGAFNGAIIGGLVYVGVARHLKRRGVSAPAASGAAPAAAGPAPVRGPSPVVGPTPLAVPAAAAAPVARQHYFVCCGSPSPITAFLDACRVARAAGWGEFRELRASVQGEKFEGAERRAKGAATPFAGTEFMGEQSWGTTDLEKLFGQIRAAQAGGSVHVAYGATDSRRAEWMSTVYRRIVSESLKQGILPFRMYVTESDEAAAALLAALEEV